MGLVEEFGIVDVRTCGPHVDADAQAQQVIDRPHPARVAPGQVVVDGDQVHALAGQGVQVQGQARHQGFALTGLHLGDLAEVQDHAAHQLDVEMPEADRAAAGLPADRERIDQQLVEVMPIAGALPELVRACPQGRVVEPFELGLQLGDGGRQRQVAPHLPLVGVQQLGQVQHGG